MALRRSVNPRVILRLLLAVILIPAALVLGLVALGSVALMFILLCVASVAAIFVAPPGVARNVFLAICTVSVCLAASEVILRWSGTAENLGLKWHRGRKIEASPPMLQPDAEYGYSYKPNGSYRYIMRRDGQLVYDVTYTIDAQGGRATLPPNDGRIAIMLGGESFHFGEGLHDHQTLAHHLQRRSRQSLRVPNFSVSGYGMHQVLRQLELDVPRRYGAPRFDWMVLSVVDNHIERVNGGVLWSDGSPRYKIDAMGQPVLAGKFSDDAPDWLKNLRTGSRLYYALTQAWANLAPTPDGRLFVAIMRRIQALAAEKYGARVLVIYYPGHTTYNDYVGRRDVYHRLFAEAGTTYIDVSLAIPDLDASYYIPGDGHPSEKMNLALADLVLKAAGIPVD